MIELKRNERIKDVSGYEGLYAVTTLGRVWSYRSNRWIKPWPDTAGYPRISLCYKGHEANPTLHRLVATTFIPNPENKPQINHINGIKEDSSIKNLEWVTGRENLKHAAKMGLYRRNVLSYEERILVCQIYWTFGTKKTKLSEIFGVTPSAIHYILRTHTPLMANA
jgi:hypothetical protein